MTQTPAGSRRPPLLMWRPAGVSSRSLAAVASAVSPNSLARSATRAPFALVLVATLFATTVWTRIHQSDAAHLFNWVSSNVHNLSVAPLRSMVLSALFLPDQAWLVNAAILLAVIIPLERAVGTRRALLIFAAAHVLATALTEGWEYMAIRAGALPGSAAFQEDVGVSYGMYGVAAAVCVLLPRRLRNLAVIALVAYVGIPLLLEPGMTTSGHVLSVVIGVAWWPYLRRFGRPARR